MEKILASIIAGLSPILFTYIFKMLEQKGKTNMRNTELEEAQKRVDFLNSCYQTQQNLLDAAGLSALKAQIAAELTEVRDGINAMYRTRELLAVNEIGPFQKLFLTFKPASITGWISHILFYTNLMFLIFSFIGIAQDDQYNLSFTALKNNLQDGDMIMGLIFFLLLLLLFWGLALWSHKRTAVRKASLGEASVA